MLALEIGPGDEVIVPGQTFVCTATCASARGAKVVFADVDPMTMCLDPKAVQAKITPNTKAIIPVHFAGHACDVIAFDAISKKHNIPIIYDAAHAVATKYQGEPIGKFGLASCYSFQSNKNMTTLGEGGAITTNDADFAEKVRRMKTFGYVYGPKLRVVSVGFNYRMTKPQAAVGITQLAKIDRVVKDRQQRSQIMSDLLKDIDEVIAPVGIDENHACHIYVIQLKLDKLTCTRDELKKQLMDEHQVGTALHYPAVWTWEVASEFEYDNSDCSHTDRICNSVLTLPVFPNSTDQDMQYVAWALKQTIARNIKEG
jgi:dTDP-4-amino-4,6-dideoxygalactose transaminase